MQHITILVPNGDGNNLSSIVGSYKIFTRANAHFKMMGKKKLYTIEIAGTSSIVDYYEGLFSVKPHTHIDGIKQTNLIIIPSLNHDYVNAVKQNQSLIEWIKNQYKNGAEVAAICTGAFLLATSGLLDGKSCSTHWAAADTFRNMFPNVNLQRDRLITDEHGIYTNGGAYSFLNLILYLVEKYYDRETAIFCSKVFQIEMDRQSQSEFIIFNGQKHHNDAVVLEAQSFMEQHYGDKISIEDLSSQLHVGRRNFDRRFIRATGITPLDYLQRVKVEAAKKSLESTRKTVNEVMYDVGYSDTKAFREVFNRVTGMSPIDYKTKYNKEG
ncbi:GlxA family transcriptional regulator [Confluentibacter citreus]|uniref:GlxA family transcriptional regulator n=1 Tax=Confluentibacter citreus TaxID=2007307 RepID=UPI000C28E6D7|nr:helix-turn-helix domain-containing protein [Confluentibacter citreus]